MDSCTAFKISMLMILIVSVLTVMAIADHEKGKAHFLLKTKVLNYEVIEKHIAYSNTGVRYIIFVKNIETSEYCGIVDVSADNYGRIKVGDIKLLRLAKMTYNENWYIVGKELTPEEAL